MKVLVYGSLNIDLIFSVDHIVKPGETIASGALSRGAGGKGANQAAALAKAGMQVYLAGKIGADGSFLTELLRSYGVNTDHITVCGDATGQALIQVDKKGQNSIVLYSGGNGAIRVEEIEKVLANFGSGDTLLLQNEINCTADIMRGAKKRGLRICLNPSPLDEKALRLPLDLVDVFFVNEIEGAALAAAGEDRQDYGAILDLLARRFPSAEIILTVGKEGAYYGRGEYRAKGEITETPVVDTTGAGDTFTGYFIAARYRDFSVEDSLGLACKAASIAVSRKGAMEAIPLWEELNAGKIHAR
ncbi:MAG: ribokinase [Treponema sp.]|jgi:ribokinase|nr:ribokinase [Treponema sp.]